MRKFALPFLLLAVSCTPKLFVFDGTDRTLHISNPVFSRSKEDAIDILGIEDCQPACLPPNMMARPTMRQTGSLVRTGHNLYLQHRDGLWHLIDFFPYKNFKTGSILYLTAVKNQGDTLIAIETKYLERDTVFRVDTTEYRFTKVNQKSRFKVWRKCKKQSDRDRSFYFSIRTFFPLAHKRAISNIIQPSMIKESMDILGKIVGSVAKVKVMRLFLLNPEQGFEAADVAERSRINSSIARRMVSQLAGMDFVRKKAFIKEVTDGRTGKIKRKRAHGWFLNQEFPYMHELRQLLVEGDFFKHADLVKRFRPAGRIHLLVVSGIFIQHSGNRLDVLIVGDNLRRAAIQKAVSVLESELGRELSYAVFDSNDFKYRVSMYDKLIRDVFDYPHERLIASKDFAAFEMPNQ